MPTLNGLHYQLAGAGPLLLISQSGEGDADRTTDLVSHLTDTYTVLTYDRRGLSRSAAGRPVTIADHADDVHRLLAHLTDEPVLMLGCSLGAVIGMHVAVSHPEQLSSLVAHEPIAPWLLPEPKLHREELGLIRATYLAHGLQAAIPEIVRTLGIDPAGTNAEPGLTQFPMDAGRIANFDYFIRHDFMAAIDDDLDPEALRGLRIVPAAGTTTPRHVYDYHCAEALAALVGEELQLFPGGHNGNLSHPRAYAARLREVLSPRR